jgi:long-subunit acyl-CoA synthetase (AMP-forming)
MLNGYFDTGDIVMLSEEKNLFYIGRATSDYYKDNFGVKIPLAALRKYYASLIKNTYHVEILPLHIFPGQAALLFVNEPSCEKGQVFDRAILEKYVVIVREINNRLKETIEPFEFQHRHICRISVINGKPPLTWKGTISILQINQIYKSIIDCLSDSRNLTQGVESTEN